MSALIAYVVANLCFGGAAFILALGLALEEEEVAVGTMFVVNTLALDYYFWYTHLYVLK